MQKVTLLIAIAYAEVTDRMFMYKLLGLDLFSAYTVCKGEAQ